jgi:hypothetical protein
MIVFLFAASLRRRGSKLKKIQRSKDFGEYREMTVLIIRTVRLKELETLKFTIYSIYQEGNSRRQEEP